MVHSLKMQRYKTLRFFLRLIESKHPSLDKYGCSELVLEENLHARSLWGGVVFLPENNTKVSFRISKTEFGLACLLSF